MAFKASRLSIVDDPRIRSYCLYTGIWREEEEKGRQEKSLERREGCMGRHILFLALPYAILVTIIIRRLMPGPQMPCWKTEDKDRASGPPLLHDFCNSDEILYLVHKKNDQFIYK